MPAQESDFFKSFDTDGDGVISFGEYQVILMLLALPLEVGAPGVLGHTSPRSHPPCCGTCEGACTATARQPARKQRDAQGSLGPARGQDLATIFAMFDEDDSGRISRVEWEAVTAALQTRLKRVSPVHRTGAKLHTGWAPAPPALTCARVGTRQLS